ncbi:QueT transporter family protein [Pediococcus stilesii]|uniref:QueT transporter family protein n=1 Tax=Pediococcus stilesii TaxID=331679 RepID=A0A0R2L049_9LACO|nr:QueT transporter family protein [Pediococcus stilesii]KRN95183.1 hypothetical protein IV81_GL000065 [Pediococcus stilesii]
MKKLNRKIASSAIIAALYVVITLLMAPLSFGVIQLRLSELFNHLAAFNRRYILAVTMGVLIVNIFSPLGPIDMLFGTLGTLIGTTLTYVLAHKITNLFFKFMIATLCQMPGMFLVALEMHIYAKLPIFPTYWILALGEIASMLIGAVIVYLLSKKINFYE